MLLKRNKVQQESMNCALYQHHNHEIDFDHEVGRFLNAVAIGPVTGRPLPYRGYWSGNRTPTPVAIGPAIGHVRAMPPRR